MPEPDYAGGDPPGFWVWIVGLAGLFLVLLFVRGC